jgi:hypothetical protein
MKTKIDRKGNLKIRPESAMENYLLKKWYQDWRERKVTLTFSWEDRNEPSGYDRKTVDP